ncbi:hypothetical protein T08_962, partial [Trichinella sp. T8]
MTLQIRYSNQILNNISHLHQSIWSSNIKWFPFSSCAEQLFSLSSSNPYRSPCLCSASTIRQSNQAVSVTVYLIPSTMFVR